MEITPATTGTICGLCGKSAAIRIAFSSGTVAYECAACAGPSAVAAAAAPVAASVPANRSSQPYVLINSGRIVGYAASNGPRVAARARRLSARIVPNIH